MFKPDAVEFHLKAGSKKQLLLRLADSLAAATGQESREIFDRLTEREKLGSTGMGDGIAIPHARIQGLDRVYAVFATLSEPVDFESIDGKPVDLICALMAPQDAGADHLTALAKVSRLLRSKEFCLRARGASSEDAVMSLILSDVTQQAA
jgi:PTS system nitrogen regulatory IIA component